MASFNSVTLVGRLARDPESKTTQSGKEVATFSIAVDKYGKDAGASFFSIQAWDKVALYVKTYLSKGSQVLVSGTLEQQVWEKDGQRQQRVIVNAQTVQGFLPPRERNQPAQTPNHTSSTPITQADLDAIPF